MNSKVQKLLDDALDLSDDDRIQLAELLLESVDPAREEELQSEWEAEIARRIHELETGTAKTIPWEDVRRELYERIRGHAAD